MQMYLRASEWRINEPCYLQTYSYEQPFVHPPRKISLALKGPLKEELYRLEALQILAPVSEPTPWVSIMIIVKKPNGSILVCLNITANECLKALKDFQPRKTPGTDGFPAEFYRFFWSEINQEMTESFNHAFQSGKLSIT